MGQLFSTKSLHLSLLQVMKATAPYLILSSLASSFKLLARQDYLYKA